MAVSTALHNSAKDFSAKYACRFDFVTFESRVEEFTFLRPNNGWRDGYKIIFDQIYKQALISAAEDKNSNLDAEAMLDDFEYTLIRPYVSENETEIKHKPYAGMDRIARLEYLDRLTKEAPSNPVALYTEKYRNGDLSFRQMRRRAQDTIERSEGYIEIAGYVQMLENVNSNRSLLWKIFHPIKNSTEKRDAALMKKMLMKGAADDEYSYEEIARAAYETFDGHIKASVNLEYNMSQAREEVRQKQKLKDAMTDSFRLQERKGLSVG